MDRLIDAAETLRDKAFIAVLYEGGSRIGELLPARVEDVSFNEGGAKLGAPEHRVGLVLEGMNLMLFDEGEAISSNDRREIQRRMKEYASGDRSRFVELKDVTDTTA